MTKMQVKVYQLQIGDIMRGSKERIVSVSVGIRTPSGKMEIALNKDGVVRFALWGKHTLVWIDRCNNS